MSTFNQRPWQPRERGNRTSGDEDDDEEDGEGEEEYDDDAEVDGELVNLDDPPEQATPYVWPVREDVSDTDAGIDSPWRSVPACEECHILMTLVYRETSLPRMSLGRRPDRIAEEFYACRVCARTLCRATYEAVAVLEEEE